MDYSKILLLENNNDGVDTDISGNDNNVLNNLKSPEFPVKQRQNFKNIEENDFNKINKIDDKVPTPLAKSTSSNEIKTLLKNKKISSLTDENLFLD
jgi:hypothetical protein